MITENVLPLEEEAVECALLAGLWMWMHQHEGVPLLLDLRVKGGDDGCVDDDVVGGVAPDGNDRLFQRCGLFLVRDVGAHFKRGNTHHRYDLRL